MDPRIRAVIVFAGLLVARPPVFAQEHLFMSDGVRIHYIEHGFGEPIVLVHGFAGSIDEWVDSGVMSNLSQDHRVIALDLRGHGKSDKPRDAKEYGEKMCLDIIRLLDHLGVAKAHIVGYSQGARLVGYLLTTHPDRFLTATLGGSPPRVGWPTEEAQRAEKDAQEMEHESKSRTADGQDYLALAAVARSREFQVVKESQLANVKVPTIGIIGSEDPRLAGMQALKKMMPALLRVVVIDGATHAGERGALKRPEFVRAVREFVTARALIPREL